MAGKRESQLALASVVWFAALACGGASKTTTTPPEDAGWQSRLADTTLAPPLYSLRFLDQGAVFTLAFVSGAPGGSCASFAAAVDAGADFWALKVQLPSAQVGAYPVVSPSVGASDSVSDAGALAFLEHQDSAAKANFAFYATAGAVTITGGPEDGGAQLAGEQLSGELTNVAFPAEAIALGACQAVPQSCACVDLDGNPVSTCDGGPGGCCLGSGQGLSISLPPFKAEPCAALCESDVDPADCTTL